MPYRIQRSGSEYAVVDDKGKTVGTHPTKSKATEQVRALYANVMEAGKNNAIRYGRRRSGIGDSHSGINTGGMAVTAADQVKELSSVVKEIIGEVSENILPIIKEMNNIKEGDMVMAPNDDEVYLGRVVHVMTEGMLGFAGSEYSIMASAEEPALLIQLFEIEEGAIEETEYFVGFKASEVIAMPSLEQNIGMDKVLDQIEELSAGVKKMTEEILSLIDKEEVKSTGGYDGCGCETCKALDVDCPDCPACSPNNVGDGNNAEFKATKPNTDEYDNSVGKSHHTIWGGSVLDLSPFYK